MNDSFSFPVEPTKQNLDTVLRYSQNAEARESLWPDQVADLLLFSAVMRKKAELLEEKYGARGVTQEQIDHAFTQILEYAQHHPRQKVIFNRIAVKLDDRWADPADESKLSREDRCSEEYKCYRGAYEVLKAKGVPLEGLRNGINALGRKDWVNVSELDCGTPEAFDDRLRMAFLQGKELIAESPYSFIAAYDSSEKVWRKKSDRASEYRSKARDEERKGEGFWAEQARENADSYSAEAASVLAIQKKIIACAKEQFDLTLPLAKGQKLEGIAFARVPAKAVDSSREGSKTHSVEENIPQLTH